MAVKTRKKTTVKTEPVWEIPENVPQPVEEMPKRKFNLMWVGALVVVLVIVGWWYKTRTWPIVAMVNGWPITRYQVDKKLWSQDNGQTLQGVIMQKLIEQELANQKVEVTQADIDKKMSDIKNSIGPGQDLNALLAARGTNLTDFTSQVTLQLRIEKLLADKLTVSDAEVTKYIQDNPTSFQPGASDSAKLTQARQAVQDQKFQTEFTTWLTGLQKKAKIWQADGASNTAGGIGL